jgi:hypothetical protein
MREVECAGTVEARVTSGLLFRGVALDSFMNNVNGRTPLSLFIADHFLSGVYPVAEPVAGFPSDGSQAFTAIIHS